MEGLPAADRQETLVWLVQAFDVMSFSETLFYDTALLLDRYYACPPRQDVQSGESQRKLLAAVCMALKTGSNAETQLPLRQVVTHLGHDQVPFDEVKAAELCMLRKLQFDVGTPTARDFLETLSTRLTNLLVPDSCRHLAEFLLQLSLCDAIFFYGHAHAVLSAAALLLALTATRAAAAAHTAVTEDLILHCPEAVSSGSLVQCCSALHHLWVRSLNNPDHNPYFHHVQLKFARASYNAVSNLQPPAAAPSMVSVHDWSATPPSQESPAQSLHMQDELDEAVSIVQQSLVTDIGAYSAGDALFPGETRMVNFRDPQQWSATLAARLRSYAETSWKVHCILMRHGWTQNRFRRPPDREQLLRDFIRASKGTRLSRT